VISAARNACNDDKFKDQKSLVIGSAIGIGIALLCGVIILLFFFNSGGSKVDSGGSTVDSGTVVQLTPEPDLSPVNLKDLLSVAISVAENGGKEVVAVRKEADIGETEGANDPKTDGYMKSHIQMYYGLKKKFPNVQIISGEHDKKEVDMSKVHHASDKNAEVEELLNGINIEVPVDAVAVWIDPLDAMWEYAENHNQYVTTMVCIAVKGQPMLGIIHKPYEQTTAWGFASQKLVSKSVKDNLGSGQDTNIASARIIVSRSAAGDVETVAKEAFGPNITVTPATGAGFKAWEVVKGTQDAYIHTTIINKWHICAGAAILNALGGKMTTLKGDTIDFGRAVQKKNEGGLLATMHNHEQFLEKLEMYLMRE